MSQSICAVCDGPIVGRRSHAVHCGPKCRNRASYLQQKAAGKRVRPQKPPSERTCPVCSGVFVAKRSDATFCSERCAESVRGECSEDDCTRGVRARGLCSMHWRRWNRAEGNEKSVWNDRRRDNYHRRRARAKGAPYRSTAFLSDVIERDGLTCSLCGDGVDMELAWPDPMSKSLDHVVPLSKGGAHELTNCRLAHLGCNVRKGNRAA